MAKELVGLAQPDYTEAAKGKTFQLCETFAASVIAMRGATCWVDCARALWGHEADDIEKLRSQARYRESATIAAVHFLRAAALQSRPLAAADALELFVATTEVRETLCNDFGCTDEDVAVHKQQVLKHAPDVSFERARENLQKDVERYKAQHPALVEKLLRAKEQAVARKAVERLRRREAHEAALEGAYQNGLRDAVEQRTTAMEATHAA